MVAFVLAVTVITDFVVAFLLSFSFLLLVIWGK
jgi:hypothetical protein